MSGAMAKVCVLVADGSEELETVAVVDVLRRAGAEVFLAGVAGERHVYIFLHL